MRYINKTVDPYFFFYQNPDPVEALKLLKNIDVQDLDQDPTLPSSPFSQRSNWNEDQKGKSKGRGYSKHV